MRKIFLSFLLVLAAMVSLSSEPLNAQDNSQSGMIELVFKNEKMSKALKELEKASGYKIIFMYDDIRSYSVTAEIRTASIDAALSKIIGQNPLTYTTDKKIIHIVRKADSQGEAFRVTGKIYDERGDVIPGANITILGSRLGTSSGLDGDYSIKVRDGDVLEVRFVGYRKEIVQVREGKKKVNITMQPEEREMKEVVVTAFGQQKEKSVVSAITSVRPAELKTTSTDLTTSFAGKIPGMIAWQTGGIPGALTEDEMNTKFYIRGITSFNSNANTDPLIILDGVESSKLDLSRLSVEDIESFSVLKDASATAMYGARGANGVILVTTKKGEEGQVYTTTSYQCVISQPTKQIEVADPVTYMKMYNQAIMSRSNSGTPKYSVERINRTQSGKYPSWVYPANDWYDLLFNNNSVNHRASLSLRGGSRVMQYYASVNYSFDEGMLKSDKLNDFDCNIRNNQVGFRVNLNVDLAPTIRLVVNSNTNMDRYHGPYADQSAAYQYAFNASPVDFAPVYPADETYNWPHIHFGTTSSGATNPYMLNQRGYKERTRYSSTNRAEYIQNLGSLIKGLELRLAASIVQSGYYDNNFTTVPFKYYLSSYDAETGKHTLAEYDNSNARKTLEAGDDTHTTDTRLTYDARLYHSGVWGDHQTSLQGVFQAYERTFTPISDVLNGLPQRNVTWSGRGQYGYKDRYFAEATVAYNGSERFAPQNRWGFFPAVGGAWVVSEEDWYRSVRPYMDFLKLRLSWGKVGNDGITSTPRYVYLQDISEKGSSLGVQYSPEANSQDYFQRYKINFYGDEGIQWEVAEQTNLGIETKFLKGQLELQADIYQELRHNILSYRYVIPENVGIEVDPLDNIGETRSRGLDLALKYQKMFNNDFWIILNGTLTYNKVIYKYIEEATDKPEWQLKKGNEISQAVGYIAEGLFRDQADIDNSPRQDGDVLPGDIKYRDLNGDGVIDVNDATYIGFPETPSVIYGFSAFVNYKNWEFNMSFQGSGRRSFFINPSDISPFYGDHALLKAIADSHWSEDNQAEHPFWPRLSTYNITKHNPQEDWYSGDETRKSTYFMRECTFLRCTSLSLAYNLPKNWLKRMHLKTCKLSATTNNPFCITNFDLWDVELGENGFNYPIQRTYAIGVNVNF